jgi:hypothetical protein
MKLKLKWNWGTGIALTYSIFAMMIIAFVVYSFSKDIDLVTPDYYAKELVFQNQIDKEKRSQALNENATFVMGKEQLDIQFPAEMKNQVIGMSSEITAQEAARQLCSSNTIIPINF